MKQDYKLAVARYLEGDMEMQEMIAFEKEIKESKELQQAIKNYKSSKNSVEDLPNLTPTASAKPEAASKLPIVVSIVVVLLIAAGLYIWAPWSSGLYEKYAISRVMPLPQKSADAQGNISKGAALFNEGKFDKSRKLLQAEYMLNPQNPMLSYYFAITLVETGKEYEARTIFMNLFKGETAFKYDACYYIALSFIKEGNQPAAIEWLKKIPAESTNAAKAKGLIVELKK